MALGICNLQKLFSNINKIVFCVKCSIVIKELKCLDFTIFRNKQNRSEFEDCKTKSTRIKNTESTPFRLQCLYLSEQFRKKVDLLFSL